VTQPDAPNDLHVFRATGSAVSWQSAATRVAVRD
jgi:hypothetical protein